MLIHAFSLFRLSVSLAHFAYFIPCFFACYKLYFLGFRHGNCYSIEFTRNVFYSSEKSGNLVSKAQKKKNYIKKTTLDNSPSTLDNIPSTLDKTYTPVKMQSKIKIKKMLCTFAKLYQLKFQLNCSV